MSKRARSTNWDEEEKQLFCSVFKGYAQIIENKSLNTNTNKLKAKAWEEVHQKFNSLNNRERDLNQLKIQWKGMKANARKELGTFKKECNKTLPNTHGSIEELDANVDIQMHIQELTKSMDDQVLATPMGKFHATKKPACNMFKSKQQNSALKFQKDCDDYISKIIAHSKDIKEKELTRKMDMAEEKHTLEIEILKENFKSAQLERQILEAKLKKLTE